MKKRILFFILAFVLLFIAACGPSDDKVKPEDSVYRRIVKETKEKLWSADSHVVVLPDASDELTEKAGLEFISLFEEATDIKVDLEYEKDVTVDKDSYYYFVGKTLALKNSGIDYSYSLLGDSGVIIQTRDNVVYMTGATGKGIVYSVYEFMNRAFGYEFYAEDVTYIDDGSDANWLLFDYVYRPSIANPCMMAGELNSNEDLYYKYRFQNYYQTWMAENSDVYYAHTYFKILPPSEYKDEHPDFYSPLYYTDPARGNLCLTRDPAIVDTFVERCKEIIVTDDVHSYFMLGQEDNFIFCDCASCTKRIAELGGFSSGVMMEFTNAVVRKMNEWLEVEYPDRNITFVTFAYNHTKTAPVTYDEATKKYLPVSETVVAEKNVSVQYVINMCDYYEPYEKDASIVKALDGWNAISDNLTIWEYSTNFNNYVDCFANWKSMAENVRLLESHGVDYIVEQAAYNTNTTAFSELRLYLWSKLMWDSSLNTADLIEDFMNKYYKEAAVDIKKYFNAVYSNVDEIVEKYNVSVRSGGNESMAKKYWPHTKFVEFQGHLDNAYAAIEGLKASDLAEYNRLFNRIEKQELWVGYYMFKYYPLFLDDASAYQQEWRATAKKHGLTLIQEGEAV